MEDFTGSTKWLLTLLTWSATSIALVGILGAGVYFYVNRFTSPPMEQAPEQVNDIVSTSTAEVVGQDKG